MIWTHVTLHGCSVTQLRAIQKHYQAVQSLVESAHMEVVGGIHTQQSEQDDAERHIAFAASTTGFVLLSAIPAKKNLNLDLQLISELDSNLLEQTLENLSADFEPDEITVGTYDEEALE